jgi:hypothetical protein
MYLAGVLVRRVEDITEALWGTRVSPSDGLGPQQEDLWDHRVRLRHIAGTNWSTKRYLNIELLKDQQMRKANTA